ncbi:MAG: TraB/GumN family protein, partial [Methanobrevibacter sp.]|nr:TraB/GumN family protein [Methanobrevibacter sp.]
MIRECLKIIGTAHVSQNSADEVRAAILEDQPDVVAIELDRGRYQRLMNERNGIVEDDSIHITKIIKENKVGVFLVTTILSYMQNKIGEDVDIKPGSEMVAAIEASEEIGCRIALIDRDINVTLQRVLNNMTTWEKLKFIYGIVGSVFSSDEEELNIEELKEQSNIDQAMEYFKEISPGAYTALVKERDAYLAKGILGIPEDKVIAVVGAGHREGIIDYLDNPETLPSYRELNDMDKKGGIPWIKIILALIPISFVVIFFLAWMNGIHIEGDIVQFVVISMIMGFIGSIVSGSKIQSAIIGGLVAPLTIIHP